jgi:hypothetical protein
MRQVACSFRTARHFTASVVRRSRRGTWPRDHLQRRPARAARYEEAMTIPHDPRVDGTLAVAREGYTFILAALSAVPFTREALPA